MDMHTKLHTIIGNQGPLKHIYELQESRVENNKSS